MRDAKKVVMLSIFGLLMSVIVYPFLHECGHSLCAIFLGAEVMEFHIWPIPYIACNMVHLSSVAQVIVGAGGILLPIIFSVSVPEKEFLVWYCNMLLIFIEILSVMLSMVAIVLFEIGHPMKNEDMTTMLQIAPSYTKILFVLTLGLLCGLIAKAVTNKPVTRIKAFLLN